MHDIGHKFLILGNSVFLELDVCSFYTILTRKFAHFKSKQGIITQSPYNVLLISY